MRLGRLTCHAVDDPACSCEPAGDGGDATGGGESGRLPKALGEGDGEPEETLGTGPILVLDRSTGTEPVPLEDLQQETKVSTAPGEGASAACVSPAEI
jgi:hypothetical protein